MFDGIGTGSKKLKKDGVYGKSDVNNQQSLEDIIYLEEPLALEDKITSTL